MKIGTLYSSLVLDRDSRIYTGQSDPVSGNVILEFEAWDRKKGETTTKEFFGPVKITMVLEGDLKTEVDEEYIRSIPHPKYGDERKLFHQTHVLHNSQCRASVGEEKKFPFKLYFPERALPTPRQRMSGITEREWDVMPPTLKVEFAGPHGSGRTNVDYRLSVEVEIAGIEVDVASRGVSPTLNYRPANPEQRTPNPPRSFEQGFTVTSEEFIPESERPHGFRAKAKALMKDVEPPTYAFDLVWMNLPNDVQPGQPVLFKTRLRTNVESTTAKMLPEVTVQEGSIVLLGFCSIPTYESTKDSAEAKDLNDITLPLSNISPSGSFSKESDYSKKITIPPLPYLPCSFNTNSLSRYYKLRINMTLMVGGQKVTARRQFPVVVLPPSDHKTSRTSEPAQAGPSHSIGDDEQLPAYSEV
jgi:hypothetical protein